MDGISRVTSLSGLHAVCVVEVFVVVEERLSNFRKSVACKTGTNPGSCIALLPFPFVFGRVIALIFVNSCSATMTFTIAVTGSSSRLVVVLAGSFSRGSSRFEAVTAYANILGIFFVSGYRFRIFDEVDELTHRATIALWAVLLCHLG